MLAVLRPERSTFSRTQPPGTRRSFTSDLKICFSQWLDARRWPVIIFMRCAPVAQLDRASGYEEKAQIPLSRFFGVV